ncbi:MAG: hypothetical protein IJ740_02535 [Ruminococcus sp.]|nr:hypothetical protein [Ruminococcus sp.]
MKNLLKKLSPLAPDDSGACSVLYELGGITVICDAGGCAGNVCGFDEPRWFEKRSALFSAGLRDMDAILGRDDLLVKKLTSITKQIDAPFTAIVGTPVPAVIATDLKALERMSEKRTGLPCIALKTDGTRLYDYGEQMAYLRLFERFAIDKLPVKKGKAGVIGATPLNTGKTESRQIVYDLKNKGFDNIVCFGMDSSLDEIIKASECEKIFVIAPSGIKAAKYLEDKFGIPYEACYPFTEDDPCLKAISGIYNKKVLVVHQQFLANALRDILESQHDCQVTCASWFMIDNDYAREGDKHITCEDDMVTLASNYDVVLADIRFKRLLKDFGGEFISLSHFAVSGTLDKDLKQ